MVGFVGRVVGPFAAVLVAVGFVVLALGPGLGGAGGAGAATVRKVACAGASRGTCLALSAVAAISIATLVSNGNAVSGVNPRTVFSSAHAIAPGTCLPSIVTPALEPLRACPSAR